MEQRKTIERFENALAILCRNGIVILPENTKTKVVKAIDALNAILASSTTQTTDQSIHHDKLEISELEKQDLPSRLAKPNHSRILAGQSPTERYLRVLETIYGFRKITVPEITKKKIEKTIDTLNQILYSLSKPMPDNMPATDSKIRQPKFAQLPKRPSSEKLNLLHTHIPPAPESLYCPYCKNPVKSINMDKHVLEKCPKKPNQPAPLENYSPNPSQNSTSNKSPSSLPKKKNPFNKYSKEVLSMGPPKTNKSNTPLRDSRGNYIHRDPKTGKFDTLSADFLEED